MKIVVTGTRGIPDISGGVETHCENLYPRIQVLAMRLHSPRYIGYPPCPGNNYLHRFTEL